MLLDLDLVKEIMRISTGILKNNFFYDSEACARFLNLYNYRLGLAYNAFEAEVDDECRIQLKYNPDCRKDFTCYFASSFLHDSLVEDCFFTEWELDAFENMLPQFQGETDGKQNRKGTNYRKLPNEL